MMKWVFLVFSLAGLGFLTGGYYTYSNTQAFLQTASKVDGVVIENDRRVSRDSDGGRSTSYYPIVKFSTEKGKDITFKSNTGSNPASYGVGEKVRVLYQTEAPQDAKIQSFASLWLVPMILSIIGGCFFLIGSVLFGFALKKEKEQAWAKRNGTLVKTEVIDVYYNTSYKVNGRSPWVVVCQWTSPKTNRIFTFKSKNLWFDPSSHLEKGALVDVKLDTRNPKIYWMNIDSVLPQAA